MFIELRATIPIGTPIPILQFTKWQKYFAQTYGNRPTIDIYLSDTDSDDDDFDKPIFDCVQERYYNDADKTLLDKIILIPNSGTGVTENELFLVVKP